MSSEEDDNQIVKSEFTKNFCLRMVSLRDDDLLIDKASYTEVREETDFSPPLGKIHGRFQTQKYDITIKEILHFSIGQINQFCFNWPYVTFSGLNNSVIVVNAHNL